MSMAAGKGPLDSFYKDSLRFGNLKVSVLPQPSIHHHLGMCILWCVALASHMHSQQHGVGTPPDTGHCCCVNAAVYICAPQCFSHFTLYLKGREELVVTVYHGDPTQQHRPPPLARITLAGYDRGLQGPGSWLLINLGASRMCLDTTCRKPCWHMPVQRSVISG